MVHQISYSIRYNQYVDDFRVIAWILGCVAKK